MVALVGLLATVASLVYLHLVPSGLSPLHNAVSQYGISAYRGGYRATTISFGVAGAALAVGVAAVDPGTRMGAVVALLVVFAIARLVISWAPMDVPGSRVTRTGMLHWLLAVAAFGSLTAAAFNLGGGLAHAGRWHASPVCRPGSAG